MLLLGHDGRFLFSFFRVAFLSRFAACSVGWWLMAGAGLF
jgi:hypothetical protein